MHFQLNDDFSMGVSVGIVFAFILIIYLTKDHR